MSPLVAWLDDRPDDDHPSDEWWLEPYDGDTAAERDQERRADDRTDYGEGTRAA